MPIKQNNKFNGLMSQMWVQITVNSEACAESHFSPNTETQTGIGNRFYCFLTGILYIFLYNM